MLDEYLMKKYLKAEFLYCKLIQNDMTDFSNFVLYAFGFEMEGLQTAKSFCETVLYKSFAYRALPVLSKDKYYRS